MSLLAPAALTLPLTLSLTACDGVDDPDRQVEDEDEVEDKEAVDELADAADEANEAGAHARPAVDELSDSLDVNKYCGFFGTWYSETLQAPLKSRKEKPPLAHQLERVGHEDDPRGQPEHQHHQHPLAR